MDHFELSQHHSKKHYYFEKDLSIGFKCLITNRTITNIGTGLFSIFLPIFLYITLGENIRYLAFYYLASYLVSLIFVSTFHHALNRIGFKRAIGISTLVGAFYYLAIFLLKTENVQILMPIMVFTIASWRLLYWIPYNIDFAKFTSKKDRGKGVGLVEAMLSFVGIITPVLAGFIISRFNFNVLFLVGIAIFLLSYLPLMKLPRTKERFSWSTSQFFKKIIARKNRKLTWFFFLDGAEGVLAAFVWPVFVYELLQGNYLEIGAISSLVVMATAILQLLAGKIVDKKKGRMIKTGGFFYALGWLLKVFALTAFHVFVFDAYHRFMKVFYRIPLDTLVFETAFRQKHFIDEFNIFRQFCLFLGGSVMTILIILLSFITTSINWIFILGTVTVFLISLFYKKIQDSFV
jgi:YQGE family putative transporter